MTDIITMPDELYRNTLVRFNPMHVNAASGGSAFNPFNRSEGPSAVFWQVDMTFSPMSPETYIAFRRFVWKLRGGKVLARLYDPTMLAEVEGTQPRGAGALTSTINIKTDALGGSETIVLKNLIVSQAASLKFGDMLGIGENLYVVEDSVPSDSNGWSSVNIQPPLRLGVVEGDPVNLVKPTGLFRLTAGGDQLGMTLDHIGQAFSLSFIEEPQFA